MTQWEFLLQKQGDQAWLPLESASAEILEGRYRIVVRSNRVDVPVEVQVSQVKTGTGLPQRRTRKRVARTNQNGMLAIIPFTNLEPGLWEFRCANDLMSDFVGERWQYAIQLQVLSKDGDDGDDSGWDDHGADPADDEVEAIAPPTAWESDDNSAASFAPLDELADRAEQPSSDPLPPPPPAPSPLPVPDLRTLAEHQSQQVVDETFEQWAVGLEQDLDQEADAARPTAVSTEPLLIQGRSLQLKLDRDIYTLPERRSIRLIGQVELQSAPTTDPTDRPTTFLVLDATLTVRLFDPQTSQPLVTTRHGLPAQPLPLPIQVEVAVPWSEQTYLLLGDATVSLRHQGQWRALPTVAFTITLGADQLLDAIANQAEDNLQFGLDDEAMPPEPESSPVPADDHPPLMTLDWATLTAPPATANDPSVFQPALGMGLPPLLARSPQVDPPPATTVTPQLPTLPALPITPSPPPLDIPAGDFDPEADRSTDTDELDDNELDDLASLDEIDSPALETAADALTIDPDPAVETPASFLEDLEGRPDAAPEFGGEAAAIAEPTAAIELVAEAVDPDAGDREDTGMAVDPNLRDRDEPSDLEASSEPSIPPAIAPPENEIPGDEATAIDAFQSLNLQARFFSRLSALANVEPEPAPPDPEPEVAAHPIQAMPTEPDVILPVEPPAPPPFAAWQAQQAEAERQRREAELIAAEVVIYEDPETLSPPAPTPVQITLDALAESDEEPSFAEEEPLPDPLLQIPTGALTAGQPIRVRVSLPAIAPRTYVKFWLTDRQTRSVLEPPRWIADFTPNGRGEMEANLELTVPQGCLEILFEGVTVEVATQRQSQKQSVYRAIVPASLPDSSLDEFEI